MLRCKDGYAISDAHRSTSRGLHSHGFAHLFERPSKSTLIPTCDALERLAIHEQTEPLLIKGTSFGRAGERWASANALREHYGEIEFSLVDGITASLSGFLEYAITTDSDFPLYLIETKFEGERSVLLDDFAPPLPFCDELGTLIAGVHNVFGSQPHFFVGGPRSGTFLHVDQYCTWGYNIALMGCKRWLFLPPSTQLEKFGLKTNFSEGGPAVWFTDHLAQLQQLHADGELQLHECLQRAGDTIFIPFGWYHAVLNLELSCAVGQTMTDTASLPRLWPSLYARHPAYAQTLRELLQFMRPEAAHVVAVSGIAASPSVATNCSKMQLDWREVSLLRNVPSETPLQDMPVMGMQASDRVLFIQCSWIYHRLKTRPSAQQAVSDGSAVMQLLAYHACIASLAAAVQECGACAVLCSDGVLEHAEEQAFIRAFMEHGLKVTSVFARSSDLDALAMVHGARLIAVLQEDQCLYQVGRYLSSLATSSCRVAAKRCSSTDSDLRLFASAACQVGDVLLSIPASKCLISDDVEGDDAIGELRSQLLSLCSTTLRDQRSVYFSAFSSTTSFQTHPLCWPSESDVAGRLAHSVSWQRVRAKRAQWEAERRALVKAGVEASREQHLWASLIAQCCALPLHHGGFVLCPVVHLAAHASRGAVAEVRAGVDGEIRLEALFALDEGDEVTVCRDADADFLDVFEKWGFLDRTAVVHTAEVIVPPCNLLADDCEEQRRVLVLALVAQGADTSIVPSCWAWWVPDHKIDECPLFMAVRATLATEAELKKFGTDSAGLVQPIQREQEARALMVGFLRAHLSGYSSSIEDDLRMALGTKELEGFERAALGLLLFEKRLLLQAVEDLER